MSSKILFAKVELVTDPQGDDHQSLNLVFDDGLEGIMGVIEHLDAECAAYMIGSLVDDGSIVVH